LLQSTAFDVCVLDVNLGSSTSLPVAEELNKINRPFIFATGYGDHTIIPRTLAHVPVIRKPYDAEDLRTAIAQALGAET
jgi:DNA-binding LytR/AlgR family response regulator